jgi:hypothetical protein
MPPKGNISLDMSLEKETKNAYRYQEEGVKGVIRNMYIQKRDLPSPPPKKIQVAISY